MFAAFLLPFPVRGQPAPYLWVFYKFVSQSAERMLFVTGKDYLRSADEFRKEDRWELSQVSQDALGYSIPDADALNKHFVECLSDDLFDTLARQTEGNLLALWKKILTERIPQLEDAIREVLSRYAARGDEIEGIYTWCNVPSLNAAAGELAIPVIHAELGSLRKPHFKPTGYFDFSGVNGNTEASVRYRRWRKEHGERPPFLASSSLRAVFCQGSVIPRGREQEYFGVALQIEDDSNVIAFSNGFDNRALLAEVRNRAQVQESRKILVRPHPGSEFQFRGSWATKDQSPDSLSFIRRCAKVFTINSSVGLEALLLDVPVELFGEAPYRFVVEAGSERERFEALTFYTLGYLVPWSDVFDLSYARWRLARPSEDEIIVRHLNSYVTLSGWEPLPHSVYDAFAAVESKLDSMREEKAFELEQLAAQYVRQIDELSRAVGAATAERDGHAAKLAGLQSEYESIVAQKQELASKLDAVAAENKSRADFFARTVAERDAELSRSKEALAARDSELTRLKETLAARDARLGELVGEVGYRDGRIAGYVAALAQRDSRCKSLEDSLAERDAAVGSLSQANAELDAKVSALNQVAAERKERIQFLERELDEKSAELGRWRERAVELLQQQAAQQRIYVSQREEMMRLSDWAARMHASPVVYAVKKYVLAGTRIFSRVLATSSAGVKRYARACIKGILRTFGESRISEDPKVISLLDAGKDGRDHRSRDVLVFSVIDWHFRIQRPQHIARGFAGAGRRVFFLSNHFVDSDRPGYAIEVLDRKLHLYQVKLHVKGAPAIYFSLPSSEAESMLRASLARLMEDAGIDSSLSIIEHPYWYSTAFRVPNSYRIYDCMDHHEGFGNVPKELVEAEKQLLASADLVVTTSSWLESFVREYNNEVAIVRNACEYDHFAKRPDEVYVDSAGRRILGYYGAIAEWFDLDLIRAVAVANPNCLVLLVGRDTIGAASELADLPNVVFTGEVPYARLPFYLYAFDVCLLPFKVLPLTLATNPVKVYEYLAAGKPAVCVDLPEIAQFGDLVFKARSTPDFLGCVSRALEPGTSSGVLAEARRSFARQQTWDHRVLELLEALERIRMPKISVVVLTYNNLELTKACLRSIVERTDYPNLEIIVVDNASSDETPRFLKEFESTHENVRVILNERNLGFAAGNNVGLAAATGDYLVILNNDTVVTRGWAVTLMRHLQADRSIGIVGPVTNNIGNEARIEIGYTQVDDMPKHAASYTLKHMGHVFPIRTVAFFCVMLPRSTYELCGPLSEEYGLGFFEDDDYCRRVEAAGLKVMCADDVFIHHHLSASFNKLGQEEKSRLFEKNKVIYESKWGVWTPHVYRKSDVA